jgi:hypothetical protein
MPDMRLSDDLQKQERENHIKHVFSEWQLNNDFREALIYSQQPFPFQSCYFRIISTPTTSETNHASEFLRTGIRREEEGHPGELFLPQLKAVTP